MASATPQPIGTRGPFVPSVLRTCARTVMDNTDPAISFDEHSGTGDARFESIELLSGGQQRCAFVFGEPLSLKIRVMVGRQIGTALVSATIRSADGTPVYCLLNADAQHSWVADCGAYEFTITIDRLLLYPGTYSVDLWLGDRNSYRVDYLTDAASFAAIQGPASGFERDLEGTNALVHQPANWDQVRI